MLAACPQIKEVPEFSAEAIAFIDNIIENFSIEDAEDSSVVRQLPIMMLRQLSTS